MFQDHRYFALAMFRCQVGFRIACQRLELRANGGRDRAAPLNYHLVSGQPANARPRARDGFSGLGPERRRRRPIGGTIYSATRRSCLPSLRPSNSRRSVSGAFSRPCCTSILSTIFPACTQPASPAIASAARDI